MKTRILIIVAGISTALFSLVLGIAVQAQEPEVPPPYAGLQNPFDWNDTAAQAAGKVLYQRYCQGCHGASGGNIASADFSTPDFPQQLENEADLNFWLLSEGNLNEGMPPFKSSLSEAERWQTLTYMWALGGAVSPPVTTPPPEIPAGLFRLSSVAQAQAGQPVSIDVELQDKEGKPIANVPIKFFTREDFFTTGLMEIGEAITDSQGLASLDYIPRRGGSNEVVARYQDTETATVIDVSEPAGSFYHTEAGLKLPSAGPEIFIGPSSAVEPTEGQAPGTALRLPGGLGSWLLLFIVFIALIWGVHFITMYQVLRIPSRGGQAGANLRLVPMVALVIIVILGIIMVLAVLTGPYSHFHLAAR